MTLRRKCTGAKLDTETADCILDVVVGERCILGRSHTERNGGLYRSENAGVSSEMKVKILHTESLRIPGEGSSALGKSGPNARPKGVVDGKQVDIPVPVYGVTE